MNCREDNISLIAFERVADHSQDIAVGSLQLKFLVFLCGRHERVGVDSLVRFIPDDVWSVIMDRLNEYDQINERTGIPFGIFQIAEQSRSDP